MVVQGWRLSFNQWLGKLAGSKLGTCDRRSVNWCAAQGERQNHRTPRNAGQFTAVNLHKVRLWMCESARPERRAEAKQLPCDCTDRTTRPGAAVGGNGANLRPRMREIRSFGGRFRRFRHVAAAHRASFLGAPKHSDLRCFRCTNTCQGTGQREPHSSRRPLCR